MDRAARHGTARIDFTATDRRTKRLIAAEGIGQGWAAARCSRISIFTLAPGTRLGLLGPQRHRQDHAAAHAARRDCAPVRRDRRADALRIVYFDQAREQLDLA